MKLPAELAGKRIRCKRCETVFAVPGVAAAKPAVKAAKPAARPGPSADAAIPLKPDDAPIGFKEDPPKPSVDDDDDDNPYGVTKDDLDVPRCPFCAKELDPPDTKICLNCGYDMLQRKRHETVQTIDFTAGDWIKHLAPGVACALGVSLILVLDYVSLTNMRSWMIGGLFDAGEKDKITGQETFYISPYCFSLWMLVVTAFIMYLLAKFAYKRLVLNWRPEEKIVADQGE